MNKLFTALALAGTTALTTGCATTEGFGQSRADGDFEIRNPSQTRGPAEAGSRACRVAKIDVIDAHSFRGYSAQYPNLYRSMMTPRYNQFSRDVTVTTINGFTKVLASSTIETQIADAMKGVAVAGAGAVALAGSVQQRRGRNDGLGANLRRGVEAGVATVGAVGVTQIASAGVDKLVDLAKTAMNGGVSEAELRERCKADVRGGAYDIPGAYNAPQEQYMQPQRGYNYQQQPSTGVIVPPYQVRPTPGYYK